jgi:hypothetical protein
MPIFDDAGHLREEAVSAILRDERFSLLEGGNEERVTSHTAICEPCRQLWNEYYLEWQA